MLAGRSKRSTNVLKKTHLLCSKALGFAIPSVASIGVKSGVTMKRRSAAVQQRSSEGHA